MTSTSVRSAALDVLEHRGLGRPREPATVRSAVVDLRRVVGHQRVGRIAEHLVELEALRRAHPVALAPDRQERRAAGRVLDDVAVEDAADDAQPRQAGVDEQLRPDLTLDVVGEADLGDGREHVAQSLGAPPRRAVQLADDVRVARGLATWPGPRFVAPNSTVPAISRSAPTIAATRCCTSPLPRDTNTSTTPRRRSAGSTSGMLGALRVMSPKSKGPVSSSTEACASSATTRSSPRTSIRSPGRAGARRARGWRRAPRPARTLPVISPAVTPPTAPVPMTRTLASITGAALRRRRTAAAGAPAAALREA